MQNFEIFSHHLNKCFRVFLIDYSKNIFQNMLFPKYFS